MSLDTVSAAAPPPRPDLALRLREATRTLHTEVERAGVMRQLLHGSLSRSGYCALLRNLHALYSSLEAALQHAGTTHPVLRELVPPVLLRVPALEQDLLLLQGPGWAQELAVTQTARDYALHLQQLGQQQPLLLAAHAYVRYLGDLNGGQMLATRLTRQLQLAPGAGVAFYSFGLAAPVDALKQAFRQCLLRVPHASAPYDPVEATAAHWRLENALVQEACDAFVRHRALFEALDAPGQQA